MISERKMIGQNQMIGESPVTISHVFRRFGVKRMVNKLYRVFISLSTDHRLLTCNCHDNQEARACALTMSGGGGGSDSVCVCVCVTNGS